MTMIRVLAFKKKIICRVFLRPLDYYQELSQKTLPILILYYLTITLSIYIALILLASSVLLAKDSEPNKSFFSIHQPYLGIRPIAMGNAFTAVADDYNALFYNPAGLSNNRSNNLIISLGSYGSSTGDSSISNLYNELRQAGNHAGSIRTTELTELAESKYGKYYYARFTPLSFFYTRPSMGIAILPADGELVLGIDKQVGPTVKAKFILDSTFALGYAWSFGGTLKGMALGLAGKIVHRVSLEKIMPVLEYEKSKDIIKTSSLNEGMGIDADVGILYNMPDLLSWSNITFGGAVRNLFDSGYREKVTIINKKPGTPPNSETRYDLGVKGVFKSLWRFTPTLAFDIRDIAHSNANPKKLYHLGTELKLDLGTHMDLRLLAGANQGYITYGVAWQAFWYLIELASYGEEVGTKEESKENRVYTGRFAFHF
ncbi:MAG: hypothetical protein HQK53_03890 [Oligoflexia bacterium]|nr:hypothetical protein [Oligoflexia bacterium]